MKKHTDKQSVDELFARKLGSMSLPPSPDGFARLQARMGQSQPETRVVFWHNSMVQRYMAVAASLLLVCLLGWLYLSSDPSAPKKVAVAVNKPDASPGQKISTVDIKNTPASEIAGTQPVPEQAGSGRAAESKNSSLIERTNLAVNKPANANSEVAHPDRSNRGANLMAQDRPLVAHVKSVEQVAEPDVKAQSAELGLEKQIAESTVAKANGTVTANRSTPVAERVLVVTIAEPEALVAARQAAKAELVLPETKAVVTATDVPEKEGKPATLWQQMKRLKQGEVFARKDAGDERGLLGRAYSGLKQTFDKDKSIKQ